MNMLWKLSAVVIVAFGLSACQGSTEKTSSNGQGRETSMASEARQISDKALPPVVTYRSPTCGCCELWVEHMRAAGFAVDVKIASDMGTVKKEAGVPVGGGSCHTAHVGPYFVEGHVPASDIKRLLAEQPDAKGLTVPGMVAGSPGMEQGGVTQPYDVLLVAKDGTTTVFAHHGG